MSCILRDLILTRLDFQQLFIEVVLGDRSKSFFKLHYLNSKNSNLTALTCVLLHLLSDTCMNVDLLEKSNYLDEKVFSFPFDFTVSTILKIANYAEIF